MSHEAVRLQGEESKARLLKAEQEKRSLEGELTELTERYDVAAKGREKAEALLSLEVIRSGELNTACKALRSECAELGQVHEHSFF